MVPQRRDCQRKLKIGGISPSEGVKPVSLFLSSVICITRTRARREYSRLVPPHLTPAGSPVSTPSYGAAGAPFVTGYGANDDDDRCGGGDVAIEASDGVSDAAVIATDDVTQALGVKPRRQFGRAHEVAVHRQLAPLCVSSVEML